MINLKNLLNNRNQKQKTKCSIVHLYEILEYVKQLNNDRKRSVGAGQGGRDNLKNMMELFEIIRSLR